jgi:hypothetical protein
MSGQPVMDVSKLNVRKIIFHFLIALVLGGIVGAGVSAVATWSNCGFWGLNPAVPVLFALGFGLYFVARVAFLMRNHRARSD